jgi:hypothetical protein
VNPVTESSLELSAPTVIAFLLFEGAAWCCRWCRRSPLPRSLPAAQKMTIGSPSEPPTTASMVAAVSP